MLKTKYIVGIAIIVTAMALLIYRGLDSSMMSYLEVSELAESPDARSGSVVQIAGIVQPGTVETNRMAGKLQFELADSKDPAVTIPVAFRGMVPDNFKPGIQVVVQGKLQDGEHVQAEQILTKCPSKYNKSVDG